MHIEKFVKLVSSINDMISFKSILFLFVLFTSATLFTQEYNENAARSYRIAFYNVENYFDPFVDSTTSYNEFTPDGVRHWTFSRYKLKRNQIYKVITALGGWQSPSIVGFAELENRFVLEDLVENTPLKNDNYQVIHFESIDHRGIDAGLIYNPAEVEILFAKPIRLYREDGSAFTTRDILYAKFLIAADTLHLFINHWPSRYGGLLQTDPLRKLASKKLKQVTDSVCRVVKNPNILIMGDFNDDPEDESIQFLTAPNDQCQLQNLDLVPTDFPVEGTLKYRSDWNTFDQVIASEFLLQNSNGLKIENKHAKLFSASFLLEEDQKHLGIKPKRTYIGYTYHGGFSDHLPVFVDIYQNNSR